MCDIHFVFTVFWLPCAGSVRCWGVFVTVFEDTDEQGFICVAVPPVSWDLGMKWLGDPDIQLTLAEKHTKSLIIKIQLFVFNLLQLGISLVF